MSTLFKLVLLLVMANVLVFFWPTSNNVAPHVYPESAELNPHFVRLNKEIEERFYSNTSELPEVSSTSTTVPDLAQEEQTVSLTRDAGENCYRLGPFMHQESYELAQAVLFNADVNFQKSSRPSQESDVYRLFLGPFDSAAEAADARLELNRRRILDHFSRKTDDGVYMISLGIYSSEETANAAMRLFRGKLEGVKMQNETVVLPSSYWLHFALNNQSSKFEQLNDIDWGENSVKLGPHTCKT